MSGLVHRAQHYLFRRAMRREFGAVRARGMEALRGIEGPLVLCPNHSNWWDGFLAAYLMRELPGREFRVVQEEKTLEQYPWFRRAGAVGIDNRSPGALRRTWGAVAAELGNPIVAMFFFPEGELRAVERGPLRLKPGLERLARRAAFTTVPLAFRYGFRDGPRPEAWVEAGAPLPPGAPDMTACLAAAMEAARAGLDAAWHEDGAADCFRELWRHTPIHERGWARIPSRRKPGGGA